MVSIPIQEALHQVVLVRDLKSDDLQALASHVVEKHYGRNEVIFLEGDPGDGLYIVAGGQISISRQSPTGDELILTIHETGEYFGELALLDGAPRSASATAIEPSSLLFLSRTVFREFLLGHPAALMVCLEVVVRQMRRLTDLVDEIALLDVPSRLARRLVRLTEQALEDRDVPHRGSSHTLYITQQHLANMIGATRESINKHLNELVDAGIIRLQRGRIHVVDLDRLKEAGSGRL